MIQRLLTLPKAKSSFVFGPRQTGKSTLIKALLGPKDLYINLLLQRSYLAYQREPGLFRQEILQHAKKHRDFTCVIDEIQRIPELLNEVHDLIENHPGVKIRFILTGSSARKLKKGGANLLAARAYSYSLFPLTPEELGDRFDLERALQIGCLPALWDTEKTGDDQEDPLEFLRTYTETYLKEEIQQEGIVRNVGPFAKFLDIAAASDGQIVNFSTLARDCGVSVKTAQEYYRILEDTFLAVRLEPWTKSARKRLVGHPKFYFFDTGVTNCLAHTLGDHLNPVIRGHRFEQFLILQTMALNQYRKLGLSFSFWRTYEGAEVDLLIARGTRLVAAVEFKSGDRIHPEDLRGLKLFAEENPKVPTFLVGTWERSRTIEPSITVLPWQEFLNHSILKG